jgi:predicted O-methyltransferase YrrM
MDRQMILDLVSQVSQTPRHPDHSFPPARYYTFLQLLAGAVQPQVSVELGVYRGGGSLHLAMGHPGGRVIGVDVENLYPERIARVRELCPNFEFWLMDSVKAAEWYRYANYGPVGILFIDTVHTSEQALAEYEAWAPSLAQGAVVVLDDRRRVAMQEAWETIPGEDRICLDNLHNASCAYDGGFGVILK